MIPAAPKHPKEIEQHGHKRVDNYFWLRDDNWQNFIKGDLNFANPEVKKYLEDEAAYTKEQMAGTKDGQKKLYDEILGRIKEDDQSCPYKRNDFYYYHRMEKGKNYPILCRKQGNVGNPEEIYFDVNKEAEGKELFIMGKKAPNDNNDLFAYCFNLTGSMEKTIKVRDLNSGKDFDWEVPECTGSFMWISNEEILFIERGPQSRGQKIYKFNARNGPDSKELIFDKPAEFNDMFMWLSASVDKEYHFLYLSSGATTRVYYKKNNEDDYKLFAVGENDVQYGLDHKDGNFYILTNDDGATNFQIFKCSIDNFDKSAWEVFIPEKKDVYITGHCVYGKKLLVTTSNNKKALPEVMIYDLATKEEKKVAMADEAYTLSLIGAHDPNSTEIRFEYESSKQPPQDIDINLETGALTILQTQIVPNYDSENYSLRREFAKGHDGAEIPLTIVYKKGLELDGSNKAYVYAYGSYGMGMPAYFSQSIFSLIDRGFVFAIAHIRGGDDKGFSWYLDGKMRNKLNTFKDYISCCEHLVSRDYTKSGMIVANGGSAGGLLMGAVTNMRPDLFKCVIADVAFVDVINTISDETLPLTPPEWEEWGNPITNKDDFEYMMRYSPYDNVEAKDYPAMLYNSGISDEQVTYWEPAKMVAKLRELKTDDNLLLLHIKMHAGHAGASKRYEWIEDKAFNYAFVLKCFE